MPAFETRELIYENALSQVSDLDGFIMEGSPIFSFPQGAWRLENGITSEAGQAANYVIWCPEIFPSNIQVSWKFKPLYEPGLAMFWFCAHGREGKDLFDPSLAKREGVYRQYFDGDINAYHASYFRRKQDNERQFHTCNLRKSKGFHLVTQGGDPIPDVDDIVDWYEIEATHCDGWIRFKVNDLICYEWFDDGETYGPRFSEGGRIGFRQMAPLIAEYKDLKVSAVELGN